MHRPQGAWEVMKPMHMFGWVLHCLQQSPHSFSDLTPLIVAVSSNSIIDGMNKELLDDMEKCITLEKVKTPNKVTVLCDYPLEGRYVALIKDTEIPDSFSINELQPILLGT